jgi:hypothetical protein
MAQSERRGERSHSGPVPGSSIAHHLNLPVILIISDRKVPITGHFVVGLADWCRNGMGMQVAARLSMDETNNIAIGDEPHISLGIVVWLLSIWIDEPIIIRILVMVARHLLLLRALGVSLDVRVQKTSSVAHIF